MRPFELDQNFQIGRFMSYLFLILCMFIYGEEYLLPFFVINHLCILCSFQRSLAAVSAEIVGISETLVGVTGVEPVTSSLSGTRSNQLSYTPGCVGGGNGIRTRDFQLAKLALYQLSYAPAVFRPGDGHRPIRE